MKERFTYIDGLHMTSSKLPSSKSNLSQILKWSAKYHVILLYQILRHLDQWLRSYSPKKFKYFLLYHTRISSDVKPKATRRG